MTNSPSDQSFLDALHQVHDFPCRYTFKVIGDNTDVFLARVLEVVRLAIPDELPATSTRESKSGKARSVTVVVVAPSAEVVVDIHRQLGRIPGSRYVL